MAISAAVTAGPNITTLSNIKFSDLRKYFLKMKPRSTFSGSETFPNDTGSVSASQLLRQETFTDDGTVNEESDIDYKVPAVPNCTENSAVATSTNWKTSQFVNTIKYYYLQQAGSDNLNLQIVNQSWNSNLGLNIRKWFFVDGTIGSNLPAIAACRVSDLVNNFSMSVYGNIYGASGIGEAKGQSGTNGGHAIGVDISGGNNFYIILKSGSRVYAGGGGGPKGGQGGVGGQGGATFIIHGMGGVSCQQVGTGNGPPGGGGDGGQGGTGRGYSNVSGSIAGQDGDSGANGTADCVSLPQVPGWNQICSGSGGKGGKGGKGGNGGDWGQGGDSLGATDGKKGSAGGDGNGGHRADHGPCAPGGCYSCATPGTGSGSAPASGGGSRSTYASAGGKAIKRSTTTIPYVLIGDDSDTLKGVQST